MKDLLGAAWEDKAKGSGRSFFNVAVDLGGLLQAIGIRIVARAEQRPTPNGKKTPSHVAFFTPLDGEDAEVGAFWPFKSPTSGLDYLVGHLSLSKLGVVELKGGAKVDFRRTEDVSVRLTAVKERKGEKSPTHQLWRMTGKKKAAVAATATTPAAEPGISDDDLPPEEEELLEEEEVVEES